MFMKNQKGKRKNFWENFRFEFVLYINNGRNEQESDHIICQRLFDVKNYNDEVIGSLELKELMDDIAGIHNGAYGHMGIIPNFFKEQSKEVCWKQYKPYLISKSDTKNIFDNEDLFTFEIKVDKETVSKSVFSGNWFQTDVRYSVNIRDIIPEIIDEIQKTFSRNDYTTTYEQHDLKRVIEEADFKVD